MVIVMVNDFLGDGLKIYKIEERIKSILKIEHNKIRKQIRAFLLLSFPLNYQPLHDIFATLNCNKLVFFIVRSEYFLVCLTGT